jgi:hypothetical protein
MFEEGDELELPEAEGKRLVEAGVLEEPVKFTTGEIDGRNVPCVSIERQVDFHDHYEPTEKDRTDLQVLAERFVVRLAEQYRRK